MTNDDYKLEILIGVGAFQTWALVSKNSEFHLLFASSRRNRRLAHSFMVSLV